MKNYYLTLTDDFNEILNKNTPTKTLKLSCNVSKNNGNMYKIINYEIIPTYRIYVDIKCSTNRSEFKNNPS